MRYQTSFFNIKWLIGGVLLFCVCFIPTFAIATGWVDYIDNVVWTRDNYGRDRIQFRAIQSFNLRWKYFATTCCVPLDQTRWANGWGMLRFQENTEIYDVSNSGWLLRDPAYFFDNDTCVYYENYVAGYNYSVYIIPNSIAGSPMPTTTESALGIVYQSNATSGEYMTLNYKNQANATHISFTQPPELTIYYPPDDAEIIGEFTMELGFDEAQDFRWIMVIFEEWNASSTCPEYETEKASEEKALGWFEYESSPYFSDFLATSTGSTTISVSDLKVGDYNCIRCYFINEITGGISLNLCPEYNLDITAYVKPSEIPEYIIPIEDWEDYYSEHSEKFETSTPIFTDLAETFEPMISWVGTTILFFQDYFDVNDAGEKGETIGDAIPIARGRLELIDDLFGGLPLSTLLIFWIITSIVVIVYRLVKGILTIIIP